MEFELTREQEDLRRRARELADAVFAARAARWDEHEERYDQTYETTSFLTSVFHFQTS